MPRTIAGPELKVATPQTIVVEFKGVTHYRVGNALLESGLLIKDGYLPMSPTDTDRAALILREGADAADVLLVLTGKIEELVGTGEIVLPTA